MPNIQWIFDGIGTEILSLITGGIIGGLTGYKLGVNNKGKQTQNAGSEARQRQEMTIEDSFSTEESQTVQNQIKQTQTAGQNSEQVQIGRIENGKR